MSRACYIGQTAPLLATRSTTSGGVMSAIDRERLLPRFWAKVNKTDTCWLWTGAKQYGGYGCLSARVDGVKTTVRAHRFAYEMFVGNIPDGLVLDHLCRVPACVNPAHLEAVTQRENTMRGTSASAKHAVKTHCPRGHEYAGSNLAMTRHGSRRCRECDRITHRVGYVSPTRKEAGKFVEDAAALAARNNKEG